MENVVFLQIPFGVCYIQKESFFNDVIVFLLIDLVVSEMTYNVSSGTLNPTIQYHTNRIGSRWSQ